MRTGPDGARPGSAWATIERCRPIEPLPQPVAALAAAPRLARVPEGRLVAGVARGLGLHLGVDPLIIRIAFVLLTFASGAGIVMYAAFWAFVPLTDDPAYGAGRAAVAEEGTGAGARPWRRCRPAPTRRPTSAG